VSKRDTNRGRRKNGVALRAQKGGDAHKGMGERGVGQEVAGDGGSFERESEFSGEVRGPPYG
jgi:hypothetical protein